MNNCPASMSKPTQMKPAVQGGRIGKQKPEKLGTPVGKRGK